MLNIHQQEQRLNSLFDRVGTVSDMELQSHWSRYLCVLVSGFLENVVAICLSTYAEKHSDEFVANHVQKNLASFQNPKMAKILEMVRSFNPLWEEEMRLRVAGRLTDSVNSIVDNRHKIAHGVSVSISMNSLRSYYKDALQVAEILQGICGIK